MKKILPIILIVIFSCKDDGITPNYGCMDSNAANYDSNANVDDGSCNSLYTYSIHIKPILNTYCVSCHSGTINSINNGELILTSYDEMISGGQTGALIDLNVSYDNTILWGRINGGGMPPPPANLSSQNLEVFKNWIEQGAQE